jgi:mycothiol S-conjugate amidase
LRESVRVLGYSSLHLLGYHDSGMPDTETNKRPDNFANAPMDEAVGKLVRIIREEQPQVIITYRDDRNFYPHPDHIKVHDISVPAFDLAGDPEAYPDAGEPWQPLKMYYVSWSIARVKALHAIYLERGEESPYTSWFERGFDTDRVDEFTTLIDISEFMQQRRDALLAHRTQVDPEGHWFKLPDDVVRQAFPWEEFTLARSLVDNGVREGEREDDLFAGIRQTAPR